MRLRRTAASAVLTAVLSGGLVLLSGNASAADLDCADYPSQAAAQAALNADRSDPNRLDANNNGVACEDHAYAASGQVTQVPTGAVPAGDGSTVDGGPGALTWSLGGLALAAAGGAVVVRRRAPHTA